MVSESTMNNAVALKERLAHLRIDQQCRAEMQAAWSIVEPHLPAILDRFYEHLLRAPSLAAMIGSRQGHLKSAQGEHWRRLFEARFDETYLTSIRKIGFAHHRIGLEPRWYIGAYAFLQEEMAAILARRHRVRSDVLVRRIAALNRAIMLDMDLALSIYQEVLVTERQRRGEVLSQAIADFKGAVQESVQVCDAAGRSLSESTCQLEAATDDATRLAQDVSGSAGLTSANMEAGAAATEELSSSVREIGEQASRSAEVAQRAAGDARRTNETIAGLAERASEIGAVVQLINDIAAQTNLLALNATIEAARAGEAGRGFAVVAQEVKTLAGQTAKATTEISGRIAAMQEVASRSVSDIRSIGAVIEEMSAIAVSIASAVEQQTAATAEIARNVQGTSQNARSMLGTIGTLGQSTLAAREAVGQVSQAHATLDSQIGRLRQDIDTFLARASNA